MDRLSGTGSDPAFSSSRPRDHGILVEVFAGPIPPSLHRAGTVLEAEPAHPRSARGATAPAPQRSPLPVVPQIQPRPVAR